VLPDSNRCDCCNNRVDREVLSLNCPIKSFSVYGIGLPLYFYLIKFSILFLSITIIIVNCTHLYKFIDSGNSSGNGNGVTISDISEITNTDN
jgi:hypothetical protein